MARRPSAASVSALPSTLSAKPAQGRSVTGDTNSGLDVQAPPRLALTASTSVKYDSNPSQNVSAEILDADSLFVNHTVSEVKAIQQRFRSDAENKQEELRLMVGERYRDLLQASTSIIAIAQSSKNVLDAVQDMRDTVQSISFLKTPKKYLSEAQDKHLHTLQSLAAHLKILLDAPEHLWRLMEQKMYLHAAWLFLLARVVHQSLLREDTDEDLQWRAYDIDVIEQFPLTQRQWDAISQFRTQITHKATLSLREASASSGHVCATLLSLHLLESRPLQETLVVFLTQRSKSVATTLSHQHTANGHAIQAYGEKSLPSRKATVRGTKQKFEAVLDIVSRTLGTARVLFLEDNATGRRSMMSEALHSMQTNSPSSALPSELQLTTSVLLTTLSSSTHAGLLPATISSYTPYVDGASSVPQTDLHQRLQQWFQNVMDDCRIAMTKWLSNLETIREVWDVRTFTSDWITSTEGLDSQEKGQVKAIVDVLCQRQIKVAWKSAVADAQNNIRERLASAITTLQTASTEVPDTRPIEYMLRAPPLPSSSVAGVSSSPNVSSCQKYRSNLQKQLLGKTPLLDDVLGITLRHARSLQEDFGIMQGDDDETRALISRLAVDCRPDIEQFAAKMLDILDDAVSGVNDDTDLSIKILVFIGRLAEDLCSSPEAISSLNCTPDLLNGFKERIGVLRGRIVDRWQNHHLQHIINLNWPNHYRHSRRIRHDAIPSRPSASLSEALLALSTSCLELQLVLDPRGDHHLAEHTFERFVGHLLDHLDGQMSQKHTQQARLQTYWDLAVLQHIYRFWSVESDDGRIRVEQWLSDEREKLLGLGFTEEQLNSEDTASEFLSRVQILFSSLFPSASLPKQGASPDGKMDRTPHLLRYGTPSADQQFQSALDLAKPPPRFGLLLVGSAAVR